MLIGLTLTSFAALAEPERLYTEWEAAEHAIGAGDYLQASKRLARASKMRPKDDSDWQSSLGKRLDTEICAVDAMLLGEPRASFDALLLCDTFITIVDPPTTTATLALRLAPIEALYGWLPEDPEARYERYGSYAQVFSAGPSRTALVERFAADLRAWDEARARAWCGRFEGKSWWKAESDACIVRFPPPTVPEKLVAALAADDVAAAVALVREAHAEKLDVAGILGPAVEGLRAKGRALDAKRLLAAAGDAAAAEEVRIADALALLGDPLSHRASRASSVAVLVVDKAKLCPSIYDPKRPPAPPECVAWLRPLVDAWVEDGKLEDAERGAKQAGLDFAKEWPAAKKRAEAQAAAAKAARLEEARPFVDAYERLRDRPDAAYVFYAIAVRYGHPLAYPAVTGPEATGVRFALEGKLPYSCHPLEERGLGDTLSAASSTQKGAERVGVALERCELRWDRECETSSYKTADVVTETRTVGRYGDTFVHTDYKQGEVVTTETCGDKWYLTTRVEGSFVGAPRGTGVLVDEVKHHPPARMVGHEGEDVAAARALELLAERLKGEDERRRAVLWDPELAAGRAAEKAGDHARALEHFGRAQRLGAPPGDLVEHLVKHWGVSRGVAELTFPATKPKMGW